ncbi:MAG: cysteine--tRNA ligase [Pseudobdellovibrio sp.]
MLRVYNTISRHLEEFKPFKAGEATIYVCGPTVYDLLHVGNFRGPVFFNMVRNWLEYSGYKVTFAQNFTDVDDKILNRATKDNKSAQEISSTYIEEYKKDYQILGLRPHDKNPKVTEFMPEILSMVADLIEKKKAYVSGGDVNFSISSFPEYGKLSGRKVDELKEGVRIEVDANKKNPLDFALWKTAKAGEAWSWPSPWGAGRPGWHIECSAMVHGLFGDQIDIHGGGLDLMFPHHENEIAQSEGCSGHALAKYWMHWNMFNFGGTKMSKSLGNVVSMREFSDKHHAEVYKWIVLSVHYRSVTDFNDDTIDRAYAGLAKFYSAMALAENVKNSDTLAEKATDEKYKAELAQAWKQIEDALNEDFGTPSAFAVVFEVIRKFNSRIRRGMKLNAAVSSQCEQFLEFMKKFGKVLSLFQEEPQKFLTELDNKLLVKLGHQRAEIDALVAERGKARDAKDFAKSDEYRKKLTDMKIAVSDTPQGSFWEVMK